MTEEMPLEPGVTYGVKELLQDIRDGLTRLDTKLEGKADKADLVSIDKRVEALEFFRLGVEVEEKNKSEKTAAKRWALPVIVTALGILLNVLGVVLH